MTEANEETIVINDLLSFISCKIKLYPKDKLIKCLKDFYSNNAATEAETTLTASLPNPTSHDLKNQNEKNIFKRLYKSFSEIPDTELPIFVCKNLNNVPKLDEDEYEDDDEEEDEDSEDLISEQKFIKAQIAEISSVVYQLKDQIQLLAVQRSKAKPSEEVIARKRKLPTNKVKVKQIVTKKPKSSPDKKNHKGLAYLQTLIDQEEEEKVKRLSTKQESKDNIFSEVDYNDEEDENDESFAEDEEEEDYDDNTLQLIANRRQRALVKNVEAEVFNGNKASSTIKGIQNTRNISGKKKDHSYDMMKKKLNQKLTDQRVIDDEKSCDYDEDYEEAFGFEDDDEDHEEDDQEELKIDKKWSSHCDKAHIKVEEALDANGGTFSIYNCTRCNFSTNDEAAIERHDCPQIYYGSEEEEDSKIFKYFCFECKFRGNNQAHFKKHLLKHPQSFSCPVCPEKIEDSEEWTDHVHNCIENENLPPDDFICNVCNVIYASPNAVRVHKSNHDPSKPYQCLICKYRFQTSEKLDSHFKLHQSKGYKCPFCFYIHKNRYTFFTHIRSHTGDTPFACSICDYRSTSLAAVNSHMVIHSTIKDVECDVCQSRFKSKQKLKAHRKIHQKLNGHKCQECDKLFKTDWLLTDHHSKCHTTAPSLPCTMCEFTANSAPALKAHMICHDKVQIFNCSLCSFRTNYKIQLDDHLKKTHLGLA